MTGPELYALAADTLLILHAMFVAFVILSLVLIYIGHRCSWRWVRNPWFRWTHLAAIGVVVLQAWLGVICPLTTWEMVLREKAGDATYQGAFIAHWVESVLYYQAPAWLFVVAYTMFGVLVVAAWMLVSPRPFRPPG